MPYILPFDTSKQMEVFFEVKTERDKQTSLWGNNFDDMNTPAEWVFYIVGYLGNLYRNRQPLREVMVRVAALAIASIEAYDRKHSRDQTQ